MKLSVIIPCRNAAESLPVQLDALAAQTWDGWWEVVVADNGSTDSSVAVAQSRSRDLPRLRVIEVPEGYSYHARNAGARASEGDAVVFIDADDQVAPGWLAATATALEEHPFIAPRFDCEFLNDEVSLVARKPHQYESLMNGYRFLPYAGGCGLGMQRWVFDRVGGFDLTIRDLADVDFCWRVQETGIPLTFVPDAVIRVRFRSEGHAIYTQARGWARNEPTLYRRHRQAGMSRSSLREALLAWLRAAVRLTQARRPEERLFHLRNLGQRVGRLEGSIGERVVYL